VIRKEFFNYNLATKDGRVLIGLIAESTPTTVTILDAKNQRTTVSQEDVETLEPAAQSLMPEKILDELDADQVRDLMRYLQSDAPAPAAAGAGQ
jgi:putative heme-binding domain-containing protein